MKHSPLPRLPSGFHTGEGRAVTLPRIPGPHRTPPPRGRQSPRRRGKGTGTGIGTAAPPSLADSPRAAPAGGEPRLPGGCGPSARRGGTGRPTNPPLRRGWRQSGAFTSPGKGGGTGLPAAGRALPLGREGKRPRQAGGREGAASPSSGSACPVPRPPSRPGRRLRLDLPSPAGLVPAAPQGSGCRLRSHPSGEGASRAASRRLPPPPLGRVPWGAAGNGGAVSMETGPQPGGFGVKLCGGRRGPRAGPPSPGRR